LKNFINVVSPILSGAGALGGNFERGRDDLYHIAAEKDYLHSIKCDSYIPTNFNDNGFVHCALEVSVISVANDYYSNVGDNLLLIKIDPLKLQSETKYESAAPGKRCGNATYQHFPCFSTCLWTNRNSSVEGIGVLLKETNGYYGRRSLYHCLNI